ncbi:MAG: hypothetical protein DMF56_23790 [Acidobacteria bacterium]|nr:MAG: hypothetical protein DMF56_23790 [Acidobacteriota bacterium]
MRSRSTEPIIAQLSNTQGRVKCPAVFAWAACTVCASHLIVSIRVLVVDDDPSIRLLVARVVARAGYAVTEAVDGRAAITALQAERFDAVVLDLMMPHVNGLEVLAFVNKHCPARPCVIITSAADARLLAAADAPAVAAKLRKPFDIAELLAALHSCITQGAP